MGYYAPSAEEVYRYIFRTDDMPRDLGDGFSWSILFLNDNTPVCHDFLQKYGAELSSWTADRVRFVFFSGLSREQTSTLAGQAGAAGFLRAIIEKISGEPKYAWERSHWERHRPEALHPLNNRKTISGHMQLLTECRSAISGTGEALYLAQKLGIGRFVPCFLLFSDIGAHEVFLFPVDRRDPDEIFARLRGWVDTFYEVNRGILHQWATIENSIEQMERPLFLSSESVSQWKREHQKKWYTLRFLSKLLDGFEERPFDPKMLHELQRDTSLSDEVRHLSDQLDRQLRTVDQKAIAIIKKLERWLDRLRSGTNSEIIQEQLRQASGEITVSASTRERIRQTVDNFIPIKRFSSPEEELVGWWQSEFGRSPSRNRYERFRNSWAHYSKQIYGEDARGSAGRIIGTEFTEVASAAMAQPVSGLADDSTGVVIKRLALHLQVPEDDQAWSQAIAAYRDVLMSYFAGLQKHAPQWLAEYEESCGESLCWNDCIPSNEARSKTKLKDCTALLPRLARPLQYARTTWTQHIEALISQMTSNQTECIKLISEELESVKTYSAAHGADSDAFWRAFGVTLAVIRKQIEVDLFGTAKSLASTPYPAKTVPREEIERLLHLLDDYECAVGRIKLPFRYDSQVMRVQLPGSLPQTFGISAKPVDRSFADQKKSSLSSATTKAERSVEEWETVRKNHDALSPGRELHKILVDALPQKRVDALIQTLPSDETVYPADRLNGRDAILALLEQLNAEELLALERRTIPQVAEIPKLASTTKTALHRGILLAIGLEPSVKKLPPSHEALNSLEKKMKTGNFDVFLAHNSKDKPDVLRLAEELRRLGVFPWVDVEQIPPGRWFQDVIQSAVRSAATAAIIFGSSGLGRWQALELRSFIGRCVESGTPVIPILLPGVSALPDDLPFLRELNHVRFTSDILEEIPLAHLVWGITGTRPSNIS